MLGFQLTNCWINVGNHTLRVVKQLRLDMFGTSYRPWSYLSSRFCYLFRHTDRIICTQIFSWSASRLGPLPKPIFRQHVHCEYSTIVWFDTKFTGKETLDNLTCRCCLCDIFKGSGCATKSSLHIFASSCWISFHSLVAAFGNRPINLLFGILTANPTSFLDV